MRILIRFRSSIRKFMVLESSDRDGSLSLTIRREGSSMSRTSWSTRPEVQELNTTNFEKPLAKNKRVTIHQSGRINYHQNGNVIFIAPLTQTTQPFLIYGYRVPSIEKLDVHDKGINDEDVVFDLSDLSDGPVSFSVFLGQADFTPQGRALKLGYEAEGYSVTLQLDPITFDVPSEVSEHFTTLTPEIGLFTKQQVPEDQALIAYHQALTGFSDLIMYAPNGEGTFRMVFSVPMRIAPKFNVEPEDPNLYVSEQDIMRDSRSDKVMLRFKVRHRKTKQIIRQAVLFKSIELDAEL